MSTASPAPSGLAAQLGAMRAAWGWFVALGLVFIVLGFVALAHLVASTFATALYVGAMVLVAGVVQVIHAFRVKEWSRFAIWLLCGLLYVVAGGLIMAQPLLAAGIITLVLGVSFVINGVFRIAAGIGARGYQGWGWIVFSGAMTLLLGAIIIAGWPVNGLMILGLLLGVDLVVNGVATLLFGLALRSKAG
ncbi:HdeD family acid-resistance protein [Azorhizobium doebereinerae]|uniref:HdeD family acid-resistance protein n=1 Tax=Azorhizobium doebereinerae TaxID=281091 RepID=UPI0004175F48|nr:HdeD family acid-resistance protein [Azorhizobium doebereinerae]